MSTPLTIGLCLEEQSDCSAGGRAFCEFVALAIPAGAGSSIEARCHDIALRRECEPDIMMPERSDPPAARPIAIPPPHSTSRAGHLPSEPAGSVQGHGLA